jgi:tRNA-dihydrouridine synthase A
MSHASILSISATTTTILDDEERQRQGRQQTSPLLQQTSSSSLTKQEQCDYLHSRRRTRKRRIGITKTLLPVAGDHNIIIIICHTTVCFCFLLLAVMVMTSPMAINSSTRTQAVFVAGFRAAPSSTTTSSRIARHVGRQTGTSARWRNGGSSRHVSLTNMNIADENGGTIMDGSSPSPYNTDIYQQKQKLLRQSTKLSLAPMMEYTDRHFRYMMRLVSGKTLLYSEMIAANALARDYRDLLEAKDKAGAGSSEESLLQLPRTNGSGHNLVNSANYDDWNIRRFLEQSQMYSSSSSAEADHLTHPAAGEGASVLQLGGSEPEQLRIASKVVQEAQSYSDYTALNLNCGCPSPKVAGKGCFGAALMHEPELVRDLTTAMYDGCDGQIPITVKCRIGTDSITDSNDDDDAALYSNLCRFIETVASDNIVTDFQMHARIAILGRSLSPAQNRNIPPLKYNIVRKLVEDYPQLTISLNGGINSIFEAQEQFEACPELAGVMVGRSMAAQPWHWSMSDRLLFDRDVEEDGEADYLVQNRWELLEKFAAHATAEEAVWGTKIRRFILKALQGLFHGEPNARKFRIALDEIGSQVSNKRQRIKNMEVGALLNHGSSSPTPPSGPPLGDLILEAAQRILSEETLMRTRQESYNMAKEGYDEGKRKQQKQDQPAGNRSVAVQEWQTQRKLEEQQQQESM